jgi:hypothetical protein
VRLLLSLVMLASLLGCAGRTQAPLVSTKGSPTAEVAVLRSPSGWTAEFRLPGNAPVWAFTRSPVRLDTKQSPRLDMWVVETPGVRLERRGWYDVLIFTDDAKPSTVRIRFEPFKGTVVSSYDPALIFTDNSVALFQGQFEVIPVASTAAAEALPRDLRDAPEARGAWTRVTFRDVGGRVLHAGQRKEVVTVEGADTYVLFGPAEPVVTKDMAAIVDPALPAWLQTFLKRSVPDLIARYAAMLGPPPGPKPTIMVSWAGPTPEVISMAGGVLPGHILMIFEGVGVLQERAELSSYARWFVAHEAAHFWLGQAVGYSHSREAWITEGGADLLAIRLVQAVDPAFDWKAKLSESIGDCATLSKGRGIELAAERGEHRAHYACGALFGLLVEQRSGRPFFGFVRALIDAHRNKRVVSRADWLAAAAQRRAIRA